MNKKIEDAFKQAYDDVPSQDNEGYVPDRASFKCGFVLGAEWALREAIEYFKTNPDLIGLMNRWAIIGELEQLLSDANKDV